MSASASHRTPTSPRRLLPRFGQSRLMWILLLCGGGWWGLDQSLNQPTPSNQAKDRTPDGAATRLQLIKSTPVEVKADQISAETAEILTQLTHSVADPELLAQLRQRLLALTASEFADLMEQLQQRGFWGADSDWTLSGLLFEVWAFHDATAALNYAGRHLLEQPLLAGAAITRLAQAAENNLPLLQAALEIAPTEAREEMTAIFLAALMKQGGLTEALAWAAADPGGPAERHVLRHWAEQDAAAALRWLERTYAEEIPVESFKAAVRPWLQAEPARAAQWLLTESTVTSSPELLVEALTLWAAQSPTALASYVNQQPALPQRDLLVETLVPQLEDLATALDWAASIQDPARRVAAQFGRLIYLEREDATLFAAAMASELVIPEVKEILSHTSTLD
jgi:hypothetical protein